MVISVIAPASSRDRVTATGPAKPCTLAVLGETAPPFISMMNLAAELTPPVTAVEVMVAPEMASMVSSPFSPLALISFRGTVLPLNWSVNAGSLDLAPRPAVSLKLSPPTLMPVMTLSLSTPTVTTISPPYPPTVVATT